MSNDNKELNALLRKSNLKVMSKSTGKSPTAFGSYPDDGWDDDDMVIMGNTQWSTKDDKIFFPTTKTRKTLIPGVYEIRMNPSAGLYFSKIPERTEKLLRFPDSNSDKVIAEIEKFWERETLWNHYDLAYKRGIILWGPPGSGKSSTIQLINKDVIERGGIVIKFGVPELFSEGIRYFREIQPDTPVVVLMEDIDSTLELYNESEVLNILDGVEDCKKVVFLATTNYPGNLGERIMNRPSRFDKRFKIGMPNKEARKLYFEYLLDTPENKEIPDVVKNMKIDLAKWVKDTEDFSVAHLKELFIAVVIIGDNYADTIENLRSMIESDVEKEDSGGIGFGAKKTEIW